MSSRLYRRKGSPVWYAVFYDLKGVRHRASTKRIDYQAALAELRRLEREAADPQAHQAEDAASMSDALQLLIGTRAEQAKAGKRAVSTVDFYRAKAGHLQRFFEFTEVTSQGRALRTNERGEPVRRKFPLEQLEAAHVDDYISMRRDEGAAENTIYKELVTLRAALKLCKRRKLWMGDIEEVLPVAFAPEYTPRKRWLKGDEMQKLLAQLVGDRAARVAFIVASSANWNESERALRPHIAPDLGTVHLDGTKRSSRKRDVPIVLPIGRDLLRYALEHAEGVGERLFTPWPNVRRDLHAACDRAGIERCSPNDLRRTFSMWHQAAGADKGTLYRSMGHADTRMLERGVYGELEVEQRRTLLQAQMGIRQTQKKSSGLYASVPRVSQTQAENVEHLDNLDADQSRNSSQTGGNNVPRGGIEPPTRGFSVPKLLMPKPRKDKLSTTQRRRTATTVRHGVHGGVSLARARSKGE
jgi:integrase